MSISLSLRMRKNIRRDHNNQFACKRSANKDAFIQTSDILKLRVDPLYVR